MKSNISARVAQPGQRRWLRTHFRRNPCVRIAPLAFILRDIYNAKNLYATAE